LLARGSADAAAGAIRETCQTLDREANRGTLHRNAAARRKSRLARRLNALKQKATG
jgi:small subunit ribosomal protein S20